MEGKGLVLLLGIMIIVLVPTGAAADDTPQPILLEDGSAGLTTGLQNVTVATESNSVAPDSTVPQGPLLLAVAEMEAADPKEQDPEIYKITKVFVDVLSRMVSLETNRPPGSTDITLDMDLDADGVTDHELSYTYQDADGDGVKDHLTVTEKRDLFEDGSYDDTVTVDFKFDPEADSITAAEEITSLIDTDHDGSFDKKVMLSFGTTAPGGLQLTGYIDNDNDGTWDVKYFSEENSDGTGYAWIDKDNDGTPDERMENDSDGNRTTYRDFDDNGVWDAKRIDYIGGEFEIYEFNNGQWVLKNRYVPPPPLNLDTDPFAQLDMPPTDSDTATT